VGMAWPDTWLCGGELFPPVTVAPTVVLTGGMVCDIFDIESILIQ
jgi:hypothetical protein